MMNDIHPTLQAATRLPKRLRGPRKEVPLHTLSLSSDPFVVIPRRDHHRPVKFLGQVAHRPPLTVPMALLLRGGGKVEHLIGDAVARQLRLVTGREGGQFGGGLKVARSWPRACDVEP